VTPLGFRPDFRITVAYSADGVTVKVAGEVDLATAPELGGVVDGEIDRGLLALVLDLAELEFIDARGLAVIAHSSGRLRPLGGHITLRSPPAMLVRMMDITGLTAAVRLESEPSSQAIPRQTPNWSGDRVSDPASHLWRVTSVPAANDVVDSALRLVVALATATVEGADGVSVTLNRQGRLSTVAASDQTVLDMDGDQYATGEGPCLDASFEGRPFHAPSLAYESRWPAFTPRALGRGINSILSTPLMAEDMPVGALNVYSRTASVFAEKEEQLASIFAVEASIILRDAGAAVPEHALDGRLAEALQIREAISQAQGAIMARDGLSSDDAYTTLWRLSRRSGRPLRELAADVIASTQPAPLPETAIDGGDPFE